MKVSDHFFLNTGDFEKWRKRLLKIEGFGQRVRPNFTITVFWKRNASRNPSHKILFIKLDGREESKSGKEIEVM